MQWLKGKGCPDSSESSIAIPSMSVAVLFCCSVVAALATALAAKSIFTRWGECFEMQPWQRGDSHGDVVQQAYFCLGYRELEPRLKRSNLEPVILQDPGFLAAPSNIFSRLRRAYARWMLNKMVLLA